MLEILGTKYTPNAILLSRQQIVDVSDDFFQLTLPNDYTVLNRSGFGIAIILSLHFICAYILCLFTYNFTPNTWIQTLEKLSV